VGSFLCTDQYCSRYVLGSRGKGESESGANHIGFRCVMDQSARKASVEARQANDEVVVEQFDAQRNQYNAER
jgi:hypothetical protein